MSASSGSLSSVSCSAARTRSRTAAGASAPSCRASTCSSTFSTAAAGVRRPACEIGGDRRGRVRSRRRAERSRLPGAGRGRRPRPAFRRTPARTLVRSAARRPRSRRARAAGPGRRRPAASRVRRLGAPTPGPFGPVTFIGPRTLARLAAAADGTAVWLAADRRAGRVIESSAVARYRSAAPAVARV